MHSPPLISYSGLTIILSNPSRFDQDPKVKKLLSGYAGDFLFSKLAPVNRHSVDIVDLQSFDALLPNTKLVFVLGAQACAQFFPFGHTLNQQRGYPYENNGVIYLASYTPQDAMDMQDYEGRFNKEKDGLDENESEDETEKATKGRTERKNFRFWLEQDCKRAATLLRCPSLYYQRPLYPQVDIYPNIEEVIATLYATTNSHIYLDIETEPKAFNMWCISFGVGEIKKIFVVPILRYNYTWAYGELQTARFLAALASALHRNTSVCHNAMFDLFVLAWKFGVAFGRNVYDTMLSHARKFPGVEKSLGHCMSIYTYEPYHKNEGVFCPQSEAQETQLWEYNAKDVWGMYLIKSYLDSNSTPGELASIQQVNSSISPYLLMSLLGIRYMPSEVQALVKEGDARMMQMLRIVKLLVGYELLPSSNKQMVKYFHDEMNLPVVSRSKLTGKPSLGKDSLYKLYVKAEHPVIPFCIEFRRMQKQTSSLLFTPWQAWREA